MKRYTDKGAVFAVLLAVLSCVSLGAWGAGECWVDIYDKTDFKGAHTRIEGPVELPSLSRLDGSDWSNRIESLMVGGKAQVTAFRLENFKEEQEEGPAYHGEAIKAWGEKAESYGDEEITFGPGKKEHHLGELRFHQNIKSLKIKCLR